MSPQTWELVRRDEVALVFGLEWFPLLGGNDLGQAASLARRRRASHCVVAAGAAGSVGLVRERAFSTRGRQRLCSAAAVFASQHPVGTVAAILSLPGNRQWLVAVHEGAVMTRTDQLHDDPAGLYETLRLLREAHPGLMMLDENQEPSGLLHSLLQGAREYGELQRVRTWPGRSLLCVMLLALLCAGLALVFGRGGFTGGAAEAGVPAIDPASAWRKAIAAATQGHTVHGVAGLRSVLDALHAMPVYLAGWLLTQVECRPRAAEWQCKAAFRRDEAGDNQSLIAVARPEWSLSFDPMEGASAVWSVSMPALPLHEVRLRSARHNEARLFSALQAMLPAFPELRLEAAQPLPVRAPLDAHQLPLPRPAGLAGYQRRVIHVQAPLRSLSLLLPDTLHMSWDRIVLQLGTTVDQPTLRSSNLRVSLSGVLYEIDDPHPGPDFSVDGALDGARDP